jgi:hypothetical protein
VKCRFCGGDASEPNHRLHCDGRQGALLFEEPYVWTPTRNTAEAMALLQRTRHETIERARVIAVDLIELLGSTHTRHVYAVMEAGGELPLVAHHHWLGAVFRVARFRWTGDWFVYTDPGRNIHERRIKTWTLS